MIPEGLLQFGYDAVYNFRTSKQHLLGVIAQVLSPSMSGLIEEGSKQLKEYLLTSFTLSSKTFLALSEPLDRQYTPSPPSQA